MSMRKQSPGREEIVCVVTGANLKERTAD